MYVMLYAIIRLFLIFIMMDILFSLDNQYTHSNTYSLGFLLGKWAICVLLFVSRTPDLASDNINISLSISNYY